MSERQGSPVLRVTVSGSFTKHWDEIQTAVSEFEQGGAEVLSPHNGPPIREDDGFIYLREDAGTPDAIENAHLNSIQRPDLLYVVDPGGYLGTSVALEIGYALAWQTPIWSSERLTDSPHNLLVSVGGVDEAADAVRERLGDLEFPTNDSLTELQEYVGRMARARNFDQETPEQVLILLVEEIGELAKAMRFRLHLATSDSDSSRKNIPLELADCLIYLMHLANQTGVKLLPALREKERINAAKKWAT